MVSSTQLILWTCRCFLADLCFLAEAVFPFNEFCCGWLFFFVWLIFVVYVLILCVVFHFLISYSSSFLFCCCLSCFALLILEKLCDRLFPCFRCLLVGLIDRSLSDVFGLVTLSKLVVKFCLVEGYQLFPNISAYIGCVFSFFDSCCFYLHFGFIFQVAKLFDFSLI